jgi:indole-3-glycerol phosphate synthase
MIEMLVERYEERENAAPMFSGSSYEYLRGRLLEEGFLIFAEVKRISPSKGVLNSGLDAEEAAVSYEKSGAAAISVLTDEKYFGGSLEDLSAVAEAVKIPVMMKDFVVDPLQLRMAKKSGASMILLLSELLRDDLPDYVVEARRSGIEPLVEAGCLDDIERSIKAGARIIGINSRDLHSLEIDLSVFERASELIKKLKEDNPHLIFIAESGITREEEVVNIKKLGFDGVLIGSRLSMGDGSGFISSVKSALLSLKEKL